jgi:hypothetical protein
MQKFLIFFIELFLFFRGRKDSGKWGVDSEGKPPLAFVDKGLVWAVEAMGNCSCVAFIPSLAGLLYYIPFATG